MNDCTCKETHRSKQAAGESYIAGRPTPTNHLMMAAISEHPGPERGPPTSKTEIEKDTGTDIQINRQRGIH